jgi:GTPase SAR1 family protein
MSKQYYTPDYDYLIKLLLLGDYSVGKTSFILRYTENIYSELYNTLGVDFKIKKLERDNLTVKL